MTQIIEAPLPTDTWPDPNLDGIHTLTHQSNDYLRRIHWWVRLFGIIWIIVPIMFALGAVAFIIGTRAFHETEPVSSYSKCVAEGTYGAATCARMYPG